MRALAFAAVGAALLMAGCLGEGKAAGGLAADEPASTPAEPGRVARGRPGETDGLPAVPGPEVLYFRWDVGGDFLSPEPDPYPMEGAGFSQGGNACETMVFPAPFVDACWSMETSGATFVPHLAGDAVRLSVWLQGEPPPLGSVVLEAWVSADGEVVAEGASEPGTPTTGTPAPGPDGCVLFEVDLALPADLPAETQVSLLLRADDLWGAECSGGGVDGNRIEFLTPASERTSEPATEPGPAGSPS